MSKLLTLETIKKQVEDELGKYEANPSSSIIKYMDFAKFMSLLDNKCLFLTRGDNFEDALEGFIPQWLLDRAVFGLTLFFKSEDIIEQKDNYKIELEEFKKRTFISCWNESENESYALWQIYAKQYGVAIKTKVSKLKELLVNTPAKIYKVRYLDDFNKNVIYPQVDENQLFGPSNLFVCKHEFYKYEDEIRVILISEEKQNELIKISKLSELIDEISISPFAEDWFYELVRKIVKEQYKLNIPVTKSKIQLNKYK